MRHRLRGLLGLLLMFLPWVQGCNAPDPAAPVSKVVIVGIESLSREYVLDRVARGELPHFARMMREGSYGKLACPDPLLSPMLWATMLTGQGAQKHAMSAEYVEFRDAVVAAPSSMRAAPTIFQVAGENQVLVASVGFPGTWPVEVLNGFNLSYGALPSRMTEATEHSYERDPKQAASFPETLRLDALELYTPVEQMDRRDTSPFFVLNENEFELLYDRPLGSLYRRENPFRDFAITLQRDRAQLALTRSLLEDYPVRLAGVHLELAEAVQVPYWTAAWPDHYELAANSLRRFGDTVDECYRQLDAAIGELIELAGEGAVVCVVGNRGFGNTPASPDAPTGNAVVPMPVPETMMLLLGHGVREGQDLGRVDILDVAPTLLTALDLPVGEFMDGRVLEKAFTEEFLATHPRRATRGYTMEFLADPERYPSGLAPETEEDE